MSPLARSSSKQAASASMSAATMIGSANENPPPKLPHQPDAPARAPRQQGAPAMEPQPPNAASPSKNAKNTKPCPPRSNNPKRRSTNCTAPWPSPSSINNQVRGSPKNKLD